MNTPNRKGHQQSGWNVPSRSSDYGPTRTSGITVANATASRLSSSTRATLLGAREVKNPFGAEANEAIAEFRHYLVNSRPHEINLEECSLLLHSTAKLLSLQLKLEGDRINSLAAFVTNTLKQQGEEECIDGKKRKGRKKVQEENDEQSAVPEASDQGATGVIADNSSQQNPQADANNSSQDSPNEAPVECSGEAGEASEVADIGESQNDSATTPADPVAGESAGDSVLIQPVDITLTETSLGVDSQLSGTDEVSQSENSGDASQTPPEDPANIQQGEVLPDSTNSGEACDQPPVSTQEIIIPSTKPETRKREAKDKPEGAVAKKRKVNEVPPPALFPNEYVDIGDVTTDDSDTEDPPPPILYPEVDLWNGQFDLAADPDAPLECPSSALEGVNLVDTMENLQITTPDAPTVVSMEVSSAQAQPVPSNSNDNTAEGPQTTSGNPPTETTNTISPEGGLLDLNSLTAEDQQEIQNCINQLHYLPFTCELTKAELEKTFDNTVQQLERIFKKYNMVFNRQLLSAATVVCANMVSSFSVRPTSGDQRFDETINDFRESFSQGANGMQSDIIASLINSDTTIFERTREKSVAESRATVQKRLEEMQRLIVPKYIQWPLIAENTPEFFHRVKQFEQKMKKVLADEEKKETFDVSKYEIEVLAATTKETLDVEDELIELEENDEANISSSSLALCNLEDSISSSQSRFSVHGVTSPSSASQCGTENGRKWVPLTNVFHHMKKFDRNECARHFYAVLALLSSQNLDMNYDRHFSQESAASVTTKLDQSQDFKYPRGVKIMKSRCPDADKEEIYVTALNSKSCSESFRDLVRIGDEMIHKDLERSGPGKRHDRFVSNISNASSFSNGEVHTDSDEEFVPVNYAATFTKNLFGRSRKRKE